MVEAKWISEFSRRILIRVTLSSSVSYWHCGVGWNRERTRCPDWTCTSHMIFVSRKGLDRIAGAVEAPWRLYQGPCWALPLPSPVHWYGCTYNSLLHTSGATLRVEVDTGTPRSRQRQSSSRRSVQWPHKLLSGTSDQGRYEGRRSRLIFWSAAKYSSRAIHPKSRPGAIRQLSLASASSQDCGVLT